MAFPTTLPNLKTTFNPNNTLAVESHTATGHNTPNTEVNSIAAKVGIDSSLVVTSHDYLLRNIPVQESDVDLNGNELILDIDGDSSITADTDDQIDFKVNGSDRVRITTAGIAMTSGGQIATDSIVEVTNNNGVAIDGLLVKDSGIVLGSDAQGDVYYRNNSSALARLAAGSVGQHLMTGGAAANPSWVNPVVFGVTTSTSNYTPGSTSWANLDTALDITLAARAGDVIMVSISTTVGNEAVESYLDVICTADSTSFSGANGAGGQGITAWKAPASVFTAIGGPFFKKLAAGQVSGGNVVVRLRTRQSAGVAKTYYGQSDYPLFFFATNLGQTV